MAVDYSDVCACGTLAYGPIYAEFDMNKAYFNLYHNKIDSEKVVDFMDFTARCIEHYGLSEDRAYSSVYGIANSFSGSLSKTDVICFRDIYDEIDNFCKKYHASTVRRKRSRREMDKLLVRHSDYERIEALKCALDIYGYLMSIRRYDLDFFNAEFFRGNDRISVRFALHKIESPLILKRGRMYQRDTEKICFVSGERIDSKNNYVVVGKPERKVIQPTAFWSGIYCPLE